MSDMTPRLKLPYLAPSQAQPEVLINEAWDRLDAEVGSIQVEALGDSPGQESATKIIFANATVEKQTDGAVLVTPLGAGESGDGGSIEVTDGTTTVNPALSIRFPSGTVSEGSDSQAIVSVGAGGGSVASAQAKLVASGYVTVTNPNTAASVALTAAYNVSSAAVTAQGRYALTFANAIPAGCIAFASAKFANAAPDEAISYMGIDRVLGITTAVANLSAGAVEGRLASANYDPEWFYFEIRDPTQLIGDFGALSVADLPSGVAQGSRATATDADSPTFLSTVVGGGAIICPVTFDGADWIVG